MSALAIAILRALVVLLAGFALVQSRPSQVLGDAVAAGLASMAAPVLRAVDPAIRQFGTELRGIGWAVRVSEVCDGHGLVIALAAGLAALAPDLRRGLVRFAAGVLAIQVFNLVRIITLALTLSHAPARFDLAHAGLFPLLTGTLLTLLILPGRAGYLLAGAALGLGLAWLPLADGLSAALAAPANLLLGALHLPGIGPIAERPVGWSIGTLFLAGLDPVRLHVAPLRPADFAFALPGLLAAILLATRRPSRILARLVLAAALVTLALVLGAINAVWSLAAAQAPIPLLVPDGTGAHVPQDFTPSPLGLGLVRLGQNALVHLNLLILPALIMAQGRRHA